MSNPDCKPTTYQQNLAKLPRALTPLVERPQWAVWRWTQLGNGRWQKPPFVATADADNQLYSRSASFIFATIKLFPQPAWITG